MKRFIEKFLVYGTLISICLLIASVILQILARFLLASAPSWTEEASRVLFIYAIAFSSGLAFKEQQFVSLDIFFEKFSSKSQEQIMKLISFLVFTLFAAVAFFSIRFISQGHAEFSPSMRLRMSFIFFSIWVMGASIAYYALLDFLDRVKTKKL